MIEYKGLPVEIKVPLESLVCEASYSDLELSLSAVPGIINFDIDRNQKAAFINFDSAVISREKIEKIIAEVGCRVQEF